MILTDYLRRHRFKFWMARISAIVAGHFGAPKECFIWKNLNLTRMSLKGIDANDRYLEHFSLTGYGR